MMNKQNKDYKKMIPPRYKKPSLITWILTVIFISFMFTGISNAGLSPERLGSGIVNMFSFIGNAFPPDVSRTGSIIGSIIETFEIALVGTFFGVILSLPIAILASRNTTPHPLIRTATRGVVSTLRTVPDLIWALIFVISVGLGPLAGILTIIVDTIGFCARFFSERIEEIEKGPSQALESTGATQLGIISGSVIPIGFPSFVGTSLYAVEKSIRSAVILGLVGAGGIGVELNTAMSIRAFDEALMIIILILIVVITVEQISTLIRKKVI
ncbi:phosphonate ABC transporter, permease protein PhnE [Salipaludibacillus sp. CUR1]|uniref:phosphonate ABC transporter, permease protein PhnE n=1 Tax=Salipaludibacillus sp. CUR1 TaxID=2820003 RepID=UPI001E42A2C0|nr:phosphonate ABC transporter, permease protein PhnE [Salipaludibacillus sp. CUR1]MCE7790810.1 phosphonate ABC transporter, permease protein PhnE [Salipaludibacillus sp. CUR1]